MSESKEAGGFFRKVAQFVANPATNWSDIGAPPVGEARDGELDKSEIRAMVERKRRNDFVRKREFDVLRRLRRDGLSPEQLAALGGSSRIDDSEPRLSDSSLRQDTHVKAKIDEIEQQMVGEGLRSSTLAASPKPSGVTGNVSGNVSGNVGGKRSHRSTARSDAPTELSAFHIETRSDGSTLPAQPGPEAANADNEQLPALPPLPTLDLPSLAAPAPVTMGKGLAPLRRSEQQIGLPSLPYATAQGQPALEVNEVVHDPELDEAVIAFANADFTQCERALTDLVRAGAPRREHDETWHVLFDLYRAIGQQAKFESLALDFANLFGSSAPQWFSLPRMVANAAANEPNTAAPASTRQAGEMGWISPHNLDTESVTRLRSTCLQLPLPWVFDWSALRQMDAEAASNLNVLFQHWATQRLAMRWLSGDQLLATLAEAAPNGSRDADPAFWMARMGALRLANRPDQYDEAAIDYCLTYEVSPPAWERAHCAVHFSGATLSTTAPPMSIVSDVSTSFLDTDMPDNAQSATRQASVELSGQLVGDIGPTLASIDQRLGAATLINVSCSRLIRVDFIAAGDLLNWVLANRGKERSVSFSDSHRLVAMFFGAMGINEHARVLVRQD